MIGYGSECHIFKECLARLVKLCHMRILMFQTVHFIEEEFLSHYTDEIRETAGMVNVLAKIARNDNTRALGLHIFDAHLLKQ